LKACEEEEEMPPILIKGGNRLEEWYVLPTFCMNSSVVDEVVAEVCFCCVLIPEVVSRILAAAAAWATGILLLTLS
jgi:hypothetical protein